jgi:hypothetical protein
VLCPAAENKAALCVELCFRGSESSLMSKADMKARRGRAGTAAKAGAENHSKRKHSVMTVIFIFLLRASTQAS